MRLDALWHTLQNDGLSNVIDDDILSSELCLDDGILRVFIFRAGVDVERCWIISERCWCRFIIYIRRHVVNIAWFCMRLDGWIVAWGKHIGNFSKQFWMDNIHSAFKIMSVQSARGFVAQLFCSLCLIARLTSLMNTSLRGRATYSSVALQNRAFTWSAYCWRLFWVLDAALIYYIFPSHL